MQTSGLAEPAAVLSLMPAAPAQRRLAFAIMLASVLVFLLAAPFARMQLPRIDAFIPAYEAALAICDLVTAALLFGQVAITGARKLLVVAAAYLFAAVMTIVHALTFPGLFSATGLLGAGEQTTAWLYMFWHGGFAAAVIRYALFKPAADGGAHVHPGRAIPGAMLAVFALAAVLAALSTSGHAALPPIMRGHHYTETMIFVIGTVETLGLLALLLLFRRRPRTVLDVWLSAVMCAYLCDIALSAVLNAGRFDLGFYAGRAFGLLAASFLLIALLVETIALYARLARALAFERQERERRLDELRAELVHVARMNELGQMVSALAHEINQPLAAIANYLRASQRLLGNGNEAMVRTALDKAIAEADRAGAIIRRLRDFLRKGDGVRQNENLATVLDESLALALVASDRRGGTVDTRVDPAAATACIDRVQVQQVLLNLIRNAMEAMRDTPAPALLLATAPAADHMVEISVADNGPGLEAAVRERLFKPFVTTKRDGMGVGLSICRSIVEAHHGRIWAEQNPGGGTLFRFTVPGAESAAAAMPDTTALARPTAA